MGSGVENTKFAHRKTMQNPVVDIPNGAICCKLGPQTILGAPPLNPKWGPSGPEAPFWGVVRFWTPFSEKMLQNLCVLHGLGAGEVRKTGSTRSE